MKRPMLKDVPARVVAERLAPNICKINGDDDLEETIADLEKALSREGYASGYELLKCLDDMGWIVDRAADELVEELGCADGIRREIHGEMVRKWVRWENIKPKLAIGAAATITCRGAEHRGEILRIDAERAEYIVCVPALGHVKEGTGTHGFVYPFEEVEAGASQPDAA